MAETAVGGCRCDMFPSENELRPLVHQNVNISAWGGGAGALAPHLVHNPLCFVCKSFVVASRLGVATRGFGFVSGVFVLFWPFGSFWAILGIKTTTAWHRRGVWGMNQTSLGPHSLHNQVCFVGVSFRITSTTRKLSIFGIFGCFQPPLGPGPQTHQ